MSVSFAIMAHPDRARFVPGLLEGIGDPAAAVVWAEPPFATPADHGPVWTTKRRALHAADSGATHHCVVQDDAVLAPGFRQRCEDLVAAVGGDRLHILFYRDKRAWPREQELSRRARQRGWFLTHEYVLGVAVIVPTHLIADCIAYCDAVEDSTLGDDDRMKAWTRARGIEVCVPIPSLVDHRQLPSLIGHLPGRRAWSFAS